MFGDHVWARLYALDDESGHHEGHNCVLGDTNAHEGNKAGTRGSLVCGCLTGDALDHACSDFVPILAHLFVDRISRKLRNHWSAPGKDAQQRTHYAAAQGAWPYSLEFGPRRHELDFAVEWRP